MSTSILNPRSLFSSLPPPAETLAILIGTAELTIFGLAGLRDPTSWSQGFGIPLLPSVGSSPDTQVSKKSQSKEAHQTQRALITALCARNIQNGLLILTFGAYLRDRRALGVAIALGVVTTVTDYVVVQAYGLKEMAGGHLIGVGNCILVGGSLLIWGREDNWKFW